MNTDLYMSWLRTILKLVGGVLGTYGYCTSGKWSTITGIILAVVGTLMSQWEHESDTGPFTRFMIALGKSLPPPPPALFIFALLIPAILMQTACSSIESSLAPTGTVTPGANGSPIGTAQNGNLTFTAGNTTYDLGKVSADASSGIQVALTNAVPVVVKADPGTYQDFVAAQEGLTIFIGQVAKNPNAADPTQLLAIVDNGMSSTSSAQVNQYINAGISVWELLEPQVQPYLSQDQIATYALQFLTAASNGLNAGLAATPNPNPTPAAAN